MDNMQGKDYMEEKQEALEAGQRALRSLEEARGQISGAKGLGIWDLFGGGLIVSALKHLKINNAKEALSEAQYNLQVFSKELRDISMNFDIGIGDFLMVFDVLDNFWADILVQAKLYEATRKIDETIYIVEEMLRKIRAI